MNHIPRKRFGQHFLHDPGVILRIVHAINPQPGQRIVEIGPGLGALTVPVLERCQRLDVVELDRDVIPHLTAACDGKGELKWMDSSNRGYMKITLTPELASNEWVFMDTVASKALGTKAGHKMSVRKGRNVLDAV